MGAVLFRHANRIYFCRGFTLEREKDRGFRKTKLVKGSTKHVLMRRSYENRSMR